MDRRLRGSAIRADVGQSEHGTTRFIVSTQGEARDGHIIDQDSWQLDHYRSNPVVLWAHDYDSPPIGRTTQIDVVAGELRATVQWDTESVLGATVARQYSEGFLHAVSVGWRSGSVTPRADLEKHHAHYTPGPGLLFRDNEMLEFSAVPVPSDPGALAIRGLPSPRISSMTLEDVELWVRAMSPHQVLSADDLVRSMQDPAVRQALLEIVWSSDAGDDWLRLDGDADDDADDEFWRH